MAVRFALCFCALVLGAATIALADRITLKDGTVLDGVAIPQGDKYWIKTTDGRTRTVPQDDVKSIAKGAPGATPLTPGATASPARAATPVGPTPAAVGGGPGFASTNRKAQAVINPLAAVTLWQKFVDDNPTDPDIAPAQAELEKWKKLAEAGAEKINGKWVAGDERKAITDKATKLTREAGELASKNQTLQAIRKLEESARVYPNSFRTNFMLGYLMVLSDKNTDALRYLEAAQKLNPKSPQTLNNMGVAYMRMQRYIDGIDCLHKAAEYGDSGPLVQNLVNGIASIPPAARNSPKVRPALESATLLAGKYKIGGPSGMLTIVGLPSAEEDVPAGADEGRFAMSSGTGFFIDDTGLILTNRHVVKGVKTMTVVMNGEKPKSAEIVVIDTDQDLALVRLKGFKGKTPFVQFMTADNPGDGAECTVMGFPLIDRLGGAIKITRGIVSSGNGSHDGADIVTDAKVNPGNSGGPMIDRAGNIMGVVTMKSANSRFEDSYGMAISAGKVRKFLAKNNVKLTPAPAGGTPLSTEEIAAKIKPATVCILCTERETDAD